MMVPENFVSIRDVAAAADRLGFLHGDTGWFEVEDVIGPMTGLNMAKYVCVADFDLRGWRIMRKPDA